MHTQTQKEKLVASLGQLQPVVKRLLRPSKGKRIMDTSKPVLDLGPTQKLAGVQESASPSSFLQVSPRLYSIEPQINPRQGFQPQLPPVKLWVVPEGPGPPGLSGPCLLPDHIARSATCTGHAWGGWVESSCAATSNLHDGVGRSTRSTARARRFPSTPNACQLS